MHDLNLSTRLVLDEGGVISGSMSLASGILWTCGIMTTLFFVFLFLCMCPLYLVYLDSLTHTFHDFRSSLSCFHVPLSLTPPSPVSIVALFPRTHIDRLFPPNTILTTHAKLFHYVGFGAGRVLLFSMMSKEHLPLFPLLCCMVRVLRKFKRFPPVGAVFHIAPSVVA